MAKNVDCHTDFTASFINHEEFYDDSNSLFCNQNNIDHCVAYLCQELQALGFSPLVSNNSKYDAPKLVNAIYGLLGLQRSNIKHRDETDERITRLLSDIDIQRAASIRLKDKLDQTERTLRATLETNRQISLKLKALQSDLKAEKDETKRLQSIIHQRDAQYHHEKRRKEMEYNQLKERLHHAMNDKKLEKKLGFDITNTLQRPDGKRGRWNTSSVSTRHEDDLQSKIMAGYENRNKILLEENILLRETLYSMYKRLPVVGSLSVFPSNMKSSENLALESTSCVTIIDTSSALESISHLSSSIFQMPYEQVAQKIQRSFEDKFQSIGKHLQGFNETLEKEWTLRKKKLNDEISELKSKIDSMEEIIERQNLFLKASITMDGSPIKQNQDCFDEKEVLNKQHSTLMEMKLNFEKERKIYTEAVLRLARERRDFHKEKTDFYKQQLTFSPLSPESPTESVDKFMHILPTLNDFDDILLPTSQLNIEQGCKESEDNFYASASDDKKSVQLST